MGTDVKFIEQAVDAPLGTFAICSRGAVWMKYDRDHWLRQEKGVSEEKAVGDGRIAWLLSMSGTKPYGSGEVMFWSFS